MWMKKSLPFAFLIVAVVAEPPAAYGPPTFQPAFRPAGHVGYQDGYQGGYQGGFQGGYQGGYQNRYQGYQNRPRYQERYDDGAPQPFNFQYEVKDPETGNDYGHQATSDGRNVQGEYQVLLPDGRRQIVKYTADDNGYNADVRYEGEARQYQTGYGGYQGRSQTGYKGQYQQGYTGIGGYNGQVGYNGQAGYVGQQGYTGHGGVIGQRGFAGFTGQKPVYGGYTR